MVRLSLSTRAIAFAVLVVPTVAAAVLVVADHRLSAGLFAAAACLNGFTFAWYYAGTGEPRILIRNEAAIRLGANLLAIPLMMLTRSLWVYGIVLILAGLAMLLANATTHRRAVAVDADPGPGQMWPVLRSQLALTASRVVMAAGTYLGPTIVGAVQRPILAEFAALDRTQKAVNNATEAVPSGLASWVSLPQPGTPERRRRVRLAQIWTLLMAAGLLLVWIPVSGPVVQFLFAGAMTASLTARALTGLVIASTFAANSLARLVVIPIDRVDTVTRHTMIGAVVSIAGTIAGARFVGLPGALAGVALGNLWCVGAYCLDYLRLARRPASPT